MIVLSCNRNAYPPLYLQCKPPCWDGIIPGETNSAHVLEILESNKEVDQTTVEQSYASHLLFKDIISWKFTNGGEGIAFFEDDILMELDFRKANYSLENLITEFGNPEYVILTPYWGSEINLWLTFREKGILLNYVKKMKSETVVKIDPDDQVTNVTYFYSGVEQKILEYITHSSRKFYGKQINQLLQQWNGYGEVDIR